jgi:ABC-2 type transport system ATP-binding protein
MTDTATGSRSSTTPDEPTDERPAIRFAAAGKRFDDDWVLRDLDLTVRAGTVFGMIGPSGCGKTTTVRLALGYFPPDEGSVELLGQDPASRSPAQRKSVGYLPQHPVLFDDLTLWQNLNYHASLSGVRLRRGARLRELLELVDLASDRDKRVGEASGGMRRRLALAATLVHDPPVLMLDEPTAGVDPILRRQLWDEFRRLRDEGTTLVVTTQFVEEAAYCDEVAILAHGGVAAVAAPNELITIAYGGRRFDVHFDQVVSGRTLDALESGENVSRATGITDRVARIVLRPSADVLADDGDIQGPLADLMQARVDELPRDACVISISEVPVEWNDVFAEIVQRTADDTAPAAAPPTTEAADDTAPDPSPPATHTADRTAQSRETTSEVPTTESDPA